MQRLFTAMLLLLNSPVAAMVGNTSPPSAAMKRQIIMITGSSGTFCTATLIASDILLTASHCVDPRDRYKLIQFSADGHPLLLDVASAKRHPNFDINAFLNHRASADVALLKLAQPLSDSYIPASLAAAGTKIPVGTQISVAGFGVSVRGDGKTGGTLRSANLTVTGNPGTLQVRWLIRHTKTQRQALEPVPATAARRHSMQTGQLSA